VVEDRLGWTTENKLTYHQDLDRGDGKEREDVEAKRKLRKARCGYQSRGT
jgi:hypothetical protein